MLMLGRWEVWREEGEWEEGDNLESGTEDNVSSKREALCWGTSPYQ